MTVEVPSPRRDRQLDVITRQQQRFDADVAADWLDAIRRQVCPFCNAGPFTVVALHVTRYHGINRMELRDLLGLIKHESICDPFHSKAARARAKARMERGDLGIRPGPHGPYRLSAAGRRAQARKAAKPNAVRAREKLAAAARERRAARDAEIVRRLNAGELYEAIARQVGVRYPTVLRVGRKAGLVLDGRTRYGEARRGLDTPTLQKARTTRKANIEARTAEMVELYRQGSTVYELADRYGVKVLAVRGRLRKAGVPVPDGHGDPNRPIRRNYTRKPPSPCQAAEGCDRHAVARGLCRMHYQRRRLGLKRVDPTPGNPTTTSP